MKQSSLLNQQITLYRRTRSLSQLSAAARHCSAYIKWTGWTLLSSDWQTAGDQQYTRWSKCFISVQRTCSTPVGEDISDYAKAFDLAVVIRKLMTFGLHDIPIRWFSPFLKDRQQRVVLVNMCLTGPHRRNNATRIRDCGMSCTKGRWRHDIEW